MKYSTFVSRRLILGLLVTLGASLVSTAQQTGYSQTNLVANTPGVANHTDAQLTNPWGISIIPGQPFWIANNNGGTSTLYDAQGNKNSLVVGIPTAATNPCPQGCPTGTVSNSQTGVFGNGAFLFDTEDGLIANWTGQGNAFTVVDNSASGAVYKGLAVLNNAEGTFLLAANFNNGKIDVFDSNFNPAHLAGTLTDPNLPAGYAPHGVHIVGNLIMVGYAQQDSAKHDPTIGAGLGVVDSFDLEGNFSKTFATGGTLNAPWGIVAAPATFGAFANDILIGNFGDGTISAYDTQANFKGQISDAAGHVISNPGLWELVFGVSGTGDPSTLYFTAGGADQTSGLFATLVPATAATGADFSLNFSAKTVTVTAGGTATLSVGSAAVGGFNGQISLSCAPVAGLTCSFSPSSIAPGSTAASSTLTVAAAASAPGGGYGHPGMLLLSSLGLFGTVLAGGTKLGSSKSKNALLLMILALVLAGTTFTVACGSNSSQKAANNPSTATLTVTGTSGGITHSVPVTVTIR